ncbi:sugar transferase [bacterium SCSIO 12741]|nr:sugar transferase [bacterium SCSIO 12741]
MNRLADLIFSFLGLLFLWPLLVLIGLAVYFTSKGPIFFHQQRVGKWNRDFYLIKFRTMKVDSESKGQLTVGMADSRITSVGKYLRAWKLDELPQLINVFKGDMSLVGPRPEVRKYVRLYSHEQLKVLSVLPGITDYASIEYSNENELLEKADDPEQFYIDTIMPDKIRLNQKFIENPGFLNYIRVILLTIKKIVS